MQLLFPPPAPLKPHTLYTSLPVDPIAPIMAMDLTIAYILYETNVIQLNLKPKSMVYTSVFFDLF